MLALGYGLTAALLWATHDLLARKLSPGAAVLPILAAVLATGFVLLLLPVLSLGTWSAMTGPAWTAAAASGLAFVLAGGSLYRAFALAPVRLVSPVIGAFPLLSLGIAAAQGRTVTQGDWLAVAAVVTGIAVVAIAARDDGAEGYAAPPQVALGWAALSGVGFAATFAFGQEATRLGSDLPAMLVGRGVALLAVLGVILLRRESVLPPRSQMPMLAVMGALDAVALGLVLVSGGLAQAEYASVAASLFGVLTVLLAAWFLKERVRPVQWLGIAAVFTGIGVLGLQGSG
jgi:drug/metabolite transporter (DMT)-like permease